MEILDQTRLPHEVALRRLASLEDAARAIRDMQVRGAPLIGATAAFGIALLMRRRASDAALQGACQVLRNTRPTAVNLHWAISRMRDRLVPLPPAQRAEAAWAEAALICQEDAAANRAIGEHGLALLREVASVDRPLQVMTHCNAGRLATVAWGTALAPVYLAHAAGLPVHVWVSETRPRNQGLLTAWELAQAGVPHTLVADSACGHLLQRGRVDIVLVGADRITRAGDVANKIGTYLKALAARAQAVPFWVAAPGSTIDWALADGMTGIPIEERDAAEVRSVRGAAADGGVAWLDLAAAATPVENPAFDVTPAALVTGIVTERGRTAASAAGLAGLYPEHAEVVKKP